MKYLFIGDTHGDRDFLVRCHAVALEHGAELIQVGDWGFKWPGSPLADALPPMRFIDGNHDEHPWLRTCELPPGLTYQPRGSTYEDEDGTRFLFCGGAPSIDHAVRKPGRSWWQEETITEAEYQTALSAAGPVHVLVTHDAADYPPGFEPKGDPGFRERSRRSMEMIDGLIQRHRPELHVHGHWHRRYSRKHANGVTTTHGLDCNYAQLGDAVMLWSRA